MKMTVYFDGTFWAALVEWQSKKGYQALNHVFGKEPKTEAINRFITKDLARPMERQERLVQEEPNLMPEPLEPKKVNPKRALREINKAKRKPVLSTKSQLAMQASQELVKKERKKQSKEAKLAEKEHQFQLKQAKRRQKKKGH